MTQTHTELNQSYNSDPKSSPIPGAGRMGLYIFLGSLSMLFAASIVGYLVVRFKADSWPPEGMPSLPQGLWISTAFILLCSVAMHVALKAARSGEMERMKTALVTAFALAVLFLTAQAINWFWMVSLELVATANLYAFTFYMLTGLHAAHVIGGLILHGVVLKNAYAGRYSRANHPGVEYSAIYWHFLDGVWVIMFLLLIVAG